MYIIQILYMCNSLFWIFFLFVFVVVFLFIILTVNKWKHTLLTAQVRL